MIKSITDTTRLHEAYHRVFRSRDPFTPAGQPEMPVRVILFPTDNYRLTAEQFRALTNTLLDCGEREFFVSEIEVEPDPFDAGDHWICEEPSFSEYTDLLIVIENALYSSSGSWGILLSHELHALLVCRQSFWDAFKKRYPNWKRDQDEFIESWQYNEKELGSDVKWLKPFLAHLTQTVTQ